MGRRRPHRRGGGGCGLQSHLCEQGPGEARGGARHHRGGRRAEPSGAATWRDRWDVCPEPSSAASSCSPFHRCELRWAADWQASHPTQIPEHLRAKLKSVVTSILPVAPQQESRPPTPPREGTRFGPDPMYPVVARKARAAALHSRVEQVGRPAPRALSQRGLVTHPLLCTFAVTRRPHGRLLCSATR